MCRACVTKTLVYPASGPLSRQSLIIASPTCASTALRGSSSNTISASEYAARARDTRAFCPPLRLIPFSPISVSSLSGSTSMSGRRQQALTMSLNLGLSDQRSESQNKSKNTLFPVIFSAKENVLAQGRVQDPRLLRSVCNLATENDFSISLSHLSDQTL